MNRSDYHLKLKIVAVLAIALLSAGAAQAETESKPQQKYKLVESNEFVGIYISYSESPWTRGARWAAENRSDKTLTVESIKVTYKCVDGTTEVMTHYIARKLAPGERATMVGRHNACRGEIESYDIEKTHLCQEDSSWCRDQTVQCGEKKISYLLEMRNDKVLVIKTSDDRRFTRRIKKDDNGKPLFEKSELAKLLCDEPDAANAVDKLIRHMRNYVREENKKDPAKIEDRPPGRGSFGTR